MVHHSVQYSFNAATVLRTNFSKSGTTARVSQAAHFAQPERVGKMMQGDHGGHIAVAQAAQHGAVAFQGILVPTIRGGLDAAPFHRQTVGILSGLGGAVEIFLPAPAPPVAGQSGFVSGVAFLLPLPPVVVGVVAFDLMGGGGRPPQEATRKME